MTPAARKKTRRARVLPRQTQHAANRPASATRRVEPAPTLRETQLREMPDCLKNRKPGDTLTNAQCVEVMRWMADCTRDIYRAAGLNV